MSFSYHHKITNACSIKVSPNSQEQGKRNLNNTAVSDPLPPTAAQTAFRLALVRIVFAGTWIDRTSPLNLQPISTSTHPQKPRCLQKRIERKVGWIRVTKKHIPSWNQQADPWQQNWGIHPASKYLRIWVRRKWSAGEDCWPSLCSRVFGEGYRRLCLGEGRNFSLCLP